MPCREVDVQIWTFVALFIIGPGDETCTARRFIRMGLDGPIRIIRGRADRAASAAQALCAYAVQAYGRCGRFDAGDHRAGAALPVTMGAWNATRQLALPDHAQPVDRHGA